MILVEKHSPVNLREYVNQKEAVAFFKKWVSKWKTGDKALLLHGPPGVGKTSLVYAWARENKIDLIEMNASDIRSSSNINEVIGQSIKQASLFGKGKVFLLDEIDGIAGREDLGGVSSLIKIIKESRHPVILTANKPYSSRIKSLRQFCHLVEFNKIHSFDIQERLKQICEKENIEFDEEALRELAKASRGDLRSAISDLETIATGKNEVSLKDVETVGRRERELSIFETLRNIFKTKNILAARLSINNSDKDPEEIFWWIENNILNEYEDPKEIADAFEKISKADLFRRRISSRQNWRFKAYMIDLMTAGVSSSKKEMYRKFTHFQYPNNIALLGKTKERRRAQNEVVGKIARVLNCSTKIVKKEYLPYLRIILKQDGKKRIFSNEFGVDKEEIKSIM